MATTSITPIDVRNWTEKDQVLSRVRRFVMSGWPSSQLGSEFQPYVSKKDELSVLDGCLLWGSRLIIPPPGCEPLIQQLHDVHIGVSRMKSLGRGYVCSIRTLRTICEEV